MSAPEKDIYIAVVGKSHAGKTGFIQRCFDMAPGPGNSDVNSARTYRLNHDGRIIHLIDTRGAYMDSGGWRRTLSYLYHDIFKMDYGRGRSSPPFLDGILFACSIIEEPDHNLLSPISDLPEFERLFDPSNPSRSKIYVMLTRWDTRRLDFCIHQENKFETVMRNSGWFREHGSGVDGSLGWSLRYEHTTESARNSLSSLVDDLSLPEIVEEDALATPTRQESGAALTQVKEQLSGLQTAHDELKKQVEQQATILKQKDQEIKYLQSHGIEFQNRIERRLIYLETRDREIREHQNREKASETDRQRLEKTLEEKMKEIEALKAYIERAECSATGYWGNAEIPPVPYSLEPPKQPE